MSMFGRTMNQPPSTHHLRDPTQLKDRSMALGLETIVRKHLNDSIFYILDPIHQTDCLLSDVGNMMLRVMTVMSRLSEDLVTREHIDEYAKVEIERMKTEHDFSEFREGDYLVMIEEHLHKMLGIVRSNLTTMNDVWSKAPRRPARAPSEVSSDSDFQSMPSSPDVVYQSNSVHTGMSYVPQSHNHPHTTSIYSCETPQLMSHPSQTITMPRQYEASRSASTSPYQTHFPDLDVLKQRGKGTYTCPQGLACKKGGVENGVVVVFERNCNFRAHIQKHQKPYKCTLPNCQNKNGFARIDQLRRHQQMVKHDND